LSGLARPLPDLSGRVVPSRSRLNHGGQLPTGEQRNQWHALAHLRAG
jgi:hypothetical protein